MTDRFDLEQQILECWKVSDDIKTALEFGKEDLESSLDAVTKISDLRFEKLWSIFETMCHQQQFTSMNQNNNSAE